MLKLKVITIKNNPLKERKIKQIIRIIKKSHKLQFNRFKTKAQVLYLKIENQLNQQQIEEKISQKLD